MIALRCRPPSLADRRRQPRHADQHGGRARAEGARDTLGPGALAPNQLVVDTGRPGGAVHAGGGGRAARASVRRAAQPTRRSRRDASSAPIRGSPAARGAAGQPGRPERPRLPDPLRRSRRQRHAAGEGPRPPRARRLVPAAQFGTPRCCSAARPRSASTSSTRPTPRSRGSCSPCWSSPTSLLLRAFRSVILPLKAVLLNLLSVAPTYGVLVLMFQHGLGADLLGLEEPAQIEAWIPIFLFAMLFGLSMDYEVFLLSRMREEWDKTPRQRARRRLRPRAHRPDHHGGGDHHGRGVRRLHGRAVRRPPGVRHRAVRGDHPRRHDRPRAARPSLMKLLGDWNWYLPERVRRACGCAPRRRELVADRPGRRREAAVAHASAG